MQAVSASPCLFMLLGPGSDPVIGAAVGLRLNSRWSVLRTVGRCQLVAPVCSCFG